MKKIKLNSLFCAFGVSFKNISEAIAYAIDGKPKEGVYVGEDSQRYPCFDSEDYATENRFYWNLVFASSKNELDEKLKKLKAMDVLGMNYYKLTEDLAPMAYWEGDSDDKVILTDNMGERGGMSAFIRIIFLIIALAFIGLLSFAQNAAASDANSTSFPKQRIIQIALVDCSRIDTCEEERYAIVQKDGKYGIYDLQKHENVTNIEYDDLAFSRCYVAEDNSEIFYFYAEKGIEQGLVGVRGENNQTLGMWHDNPEYVGNLDECTTIDNAITKKCQSLLQKGLKELHGMDGQIAVIDAKTGRLKAWVALEKNGNDFVETKLMKRAFSARSMTLLGASALLADINGSLEDSIDVCGGVYETESGLTVRDNNCRTGGCGVMTVREALTKKSNVAIYKIMQVALGADKSSNLWSKMMDDSNNTNAMDVAASLGSVYLDNGCIYPTLKGDSVEVVASNETSPLGRQYIKDVLIELNVGNGIQAEYAPKGVEMAGVYGNWSRDNALAETSFAGFIPVQKPRYSIGVFIHHESEPVHNSKELAKSVVNDLVTWLAKH